MVGVRQISITLITHRHPRARDGLDGRDFYITRGRPLLLKGGALSRGGRGQSTVHYENDTFMQISARPPPAAPPRDSNNVAYYGLPILAWRKNVIFEIIMALFRPIGSFLFACFQVAIVRENMVAAKGLKISMYSTY